MNILALDTTTKFLCVGIYKDTAVYEYTLEAGRKMSVLITATIERLLSAAGVELSGVDCFACGIGPGSFTGIRLGLSTVKGLRFSSASTLVGIPTLETIAFNALGTDSRIMTLVDAKRSLVYYGLFSGTGGRIRRLEPDQLLTVGQVLNKIKGDVVITGDALGVYRDTIMKKAPQAILLDKDRWYPKGHNMIRLALEKISQKRITKKCTPVYLYPKECQVRGTHATGK